MAKVMSVALAAHYASDYTTLATIWEVTRRDGIVYGFTDHEEPITFEGVTYRPTSVYDAGTFKTSDQMNVDDVSLTGLLALDSITAASIEAGRWDGAIVEIAEVNYADTSMGSNVLRYGEVGDIQRSGETYIAELRGLMQALQNTIGRIVQPNCDANLGDERCGVDLEALRVAHTVTARTSNREFTASGATEAANYFRFGVVTWTSGENDGLSMEVKTFAAGGAFVLQLDMPYLVAVGDTFTAVPGCNKIGRTGDCMLTYHNYGRFRGFEDVPGQNAILLIGGQ